MGAAPETLGVPCAGGATARRLTHDALRSKCLFGVRPNIFFQISCRLTGGCQKCRLHACRAGPAISLLNGDPKMTVSANFKWLRIAAAIFLAELLPVLLLVAVVFVYGAFKQPESMSPEKFAPLAGNWVGPIGGFVATFLLAWWCARRAPSRKFLHGLVVGIGTALLDLVLGALLAGDGVFQPIFLVSNSGRVLAGILGGWLATRPKAASS